MVANLCGQDKTLNCSSSHNPTIPKRCTGETHLQSASKTTASLHPLSYSRVPFVVLAGKCETNTNGVQKLAYVNATVQNRLAAENIQGITISHCGFAISAARQREWCQEDH